MYSVSKRQDGKFAVWRRMPDPTAKPEDRYTLWHVYRWVIVHVASTYCDAKSFVSAAVVA